jgi:hypothetical protein
MSVSRRQAGRRLSGSYRALRIITSEWERAASASAERVEVEAARARGCEPVFESRSRFRSAM